MYKSWQHWKRADQKTVFGQVSRRASLRHQRNILKNQRRWYYEYRQIVDSRCRVPKITASVLSGLSRSAFCKNHSDTASEHSVSEDRTLNLLVASAVYNVKSSAYWWYRIPREQMTSSIGDTYSANRSGPRMEPCGTPDSRLAVSERSSPTAIYCDRSVTKDCNQSRAVPLTQWELLLCDCNSFDNWLWSSWFLCEVDKLTN